MSNMADLPRDIGFDDDPVVLINYIMLDDQLSSSDNHSPTYKPRPESGGTPRRRSKSSSASELSAYMYEMTESTENLLVDSRRLPISALPDISQEQHKTFSSLKEEGERGEQSPSDPFEQTNSPIRLDFRKIQDQNRELTKRNQKLSSTLDALRKERELLVWERDRLKQEKREGYTRFKRRISGFVDDPSSLELKEDSEQQVSVLQQELADRDQEIVSLREKLKDKETSTTTQEVDIKVLREEEEEPEELVGSAQYKSTLDKLIEEQTISSNLRTSNSELQLRLATMEAEIERLHLQNSHNLLLVEQVTAAAQAQAAASNLSVTTAKPPKKKSSIFGIRRSGRKKTSGGEASKVPASVHLLSTSQPSLEGSSSEHDLSSPIVKKFEATSSTSTLPYNPFNKLPDTQLLQTSVKLAMEEKCEVERQLACLREELNAYQSRLEEMIRENEKKEQLYVDAVQELSTTRQALQLATRERELLTSENEGLCLEIESVRAERDALRGKEVKAVLKEKQEMEFLRSENKALMSEIRVLIKNSDGLETSLSQLKREQVAKDVRDHEMKLKVKRAEATNEKLRLELAETKKLLAEKSMHAEKTLELAKISEATIISAEKPLHGSPKKVSFSKQSESPSREEHSPSTGQHQLRPADKKHLGRPVLTDEKPSSKTLVLHERARSEDLSSQQSTSTKYGAVPMHRTSSGGTKAVAVQATLPIKETALKVGDKSSSVPSLSLEKGGADSKKLGTFHPSSPRSFAAVNSLVKMFESGQAKTQESEKGGKETEMAQNKESKVPPPADVEQKTEKIAHKTSPSRSGSGTSSLTSSHSPSHETTPGKHSSTKEKSPSKERKSSTSSQRRISQSKKEVSPDGKGSTKDSQSKKSSSSKASSSPVRKISGTLSLSLDKFANPKDSSEDSKHTRTTHSDSKHSNQTEPNSPSKERKHSTRKFSHGSSEGKYQTKKDEERVKDQSHRRTTSLVINKEVSNQPVKESKDLHSNKTPDKKEDSSKKQVGTTKEHAAVSPSKQAQSIDQDSSEMDKEKLATISEKPMTQEVSTGKGTRLAVPKHISRFSITVAEGEPSGKTDQVDRVPTTAEKSQTWPTKAVHNSSKVKTANNTLPTAAKGGAVGSMESSPTQLKPLAISKPKPPPIINSKSSTPTTTTTNPATGVVATSPLTSSTGFVSSLRSSWEKKSNNTPLKPLGKTGSANAVSHFQERSGSFNSPSPTSSPITKSGSGPPGVILFSPSNKTSSPPPPQSSSGTQSISSTSVSPSSKAFKPFHPPLAKMGSSPLMTHTTTPTTNTTTGSVAQHNGMCSVSYGKGSVSKRISSFEPLSADGCAEEKSNSATNGTSVSPKLSRRPASLYVSSTNSHNSDKKLSSLISILQEKAQGPSSSPPPPPENKLPVPKKTLDRRETSPNTIQTPTESAYRVQRTMSLSSPIDRRTKKSKLLRWCQIMTDGYENVMISNFGESFSSGLAFCALLHHFVPEKIPYSTLSAGDQRKNFTIAFEVAEEIGIPSLLDIDDMVEMDVPDWRSVMTYVSYIYNHFAKHS